jgi:ornithine cyclodeaminase/alanine dehydrogenase-like protein (mu-crystallin family)
MKKTTLYLSAGDVRRALPMSAAIDAMRDAFRAIASKQVILPPRGIFPADNGTGVALVMPCHSTAQTLFSLKFITVFDENPERGLPLIQSLLILTDSATGEHLALIDGVSLTAIRTGAASGLATDLLARADAEVATIFGAGVQARTQLEAVCCVRSIRRAIVFDAMPAAADRFAAEMTEQLGVPVERAESPAAALKRADVVCTATSSIKPIFDDADVPHGVHINGVGTFRPGTAEIPPATACRARVVVDELESALEEAGDLIGPMKAGLFEQSHFETQLGDVLLGRKTGRESDEQITFFKSVGVAIQDLSAAKRTLDNARDLGLGLPLP